MTTYCAPCLADLALVREAVTSVSGTAACIAHAVLLTHPTDTPQRRLTRLSELRSMAEGKLLTASAEDVPAIELLVQEYALAGAMDMTVPLKDLAGDRAPRPPKTRRDRGRDRERGPRPDRERQPGERGPRPEAGTTGAPAEDSAPLASADAATSAPEPSGRSEGGDATPPTPAAPVPHPPAPAPSEAPARDLSEAQPAGAGSGSDNSTGAAAPAPAEAPASSAPDAPASEAPVGE